MYKNGTCSRQKDRECTDFRGKITVERESFKIECPPNSCSGWELVERVERKKIQKKSLEKITVCFEKRRKYCTFEAVRETGTKRQVKPEIKEVSVPCIVATPAPKTTTFKTTPTTIPTPNLPSVAATTGNDNGVDKNTYIYIIIGASFASLIFGILLGYCLTRCCQKSTASSVDMNPSEKMASLEGVGMYNISFISVCF